MCEIPDEGYLALPMGTVESPGVCFAGEESVTESEQGPWRGRGAKKTPINSGNNSAHRHMFPSRTFTLDFSPIVLPIMTYIHAGLPLSPYNLTEDFLALVGCVIFKWKCGSHLNK